MIDTLRNQTIRHPKSAMSSLSAAYLHMRNPWVAAWWSAAFPGFGSVLLGRLVSGSLLFIWELVVNTQAKLNLGILYCFTGQFDMAKQVINTRWLLIYVPVWVFGIYYGYRTTIEVNKRSILADRWDAPIYPSKLDIFSFNFLDKRKPLLAAVWSAFLPGLGQLYNQRVLDGFFVLIFTIVVIFFSHVCEGIQLTMTGQFSQVASVLDPEWLLFLPSLYGFSIFLAYQHCVESNKMFETEQSRFLIANYQDPTFDMPV